MMLINKIKADALEARKERNTLKATLLTTLYSEAANIGLNDGHRQTRDDEVVALIKKFIKGVDEVINAPGRSITLEGIGSKFDPYKEKGYLMAYLPTQMSEETISQIVKEMIIANPDITLGSLMSGLKNAYNGQYDGALASKLAKELLHG